MIVTLIPPGEQSWWLLWLAIPILVLGILITVITDWEDEGIGIGFGFLGAFLWILGWTLGLSIAGSNAWDDAREAAIASAGYSEVKITGNGDTSNVTFDAVDDGDRVKGVLVKVQGQENAYQIVIIPPLG